MSDDIRIEEDLLDTEEIPADTYYGVHTLRTIENFYVSSNRISDTLEFARGMIVAKEAAVTANEKLQIVPKSVVNAIIIACGEVLNDGECMDQSPIGIHQGGADTFVNTDTNEVLANIGLELMGHQRDGYQYPNPNSHVDECQSTNDVYPISFYIVVYSPLIKLVDVINQLCESFERKAVKFQDILRIGCAWLRGVVPMALGQELRALSILLKEKVKNIQRIAGLLLKASLDATVVGIDLNTLKEYSPLTVKELVEVTDSPYIPAEGLIEATSDYGAYVMVHSMLKRLAAKASKICNDLRLFSSDPRTGLNKISLPELQAGSSIIPARTNPVIPGVANRVCLKVIGNGTTVTMTAEVGQLQLSVTEPVIDQAVFESVHILTNACHNLLEKRVNGITTNEEVCESHVCNSIGIVTYLNPFIGHHNNDIVSKICIETGKSVREIVLERGLLIEAELDDISSVQNLMHPVYKAKCCADRSEQ